MRESGTTYLLPALHKQFAKTPNVIGNPRFHRRGYAQGCVNSAEIVEGEMQRNRCLQVYKFLGESIRQPRESSQLHSDG
jgi:hypothetical protein